MTRNHGYKLRDAVVLMLSTQLPKQCIVRQLKSDELGRHLRFLSSLLDLPTTLIKGRDHRDATRVLDTPRWHPTVFAPKCAFIDYIEQRQTHTLLRWSERVETAMSQTSLPTEKASATGPSGISHSAIRSSNHTPPLPTNAHKSYCVVYKLLLHALRAVHPLRLLYNFAGLTARE